MRNLVENGVQDIFESKICHFLVLWKVVLRVKNGSDVFHCSHVVVGHEDLVKLAKRIWRSEVVFIEIDAPHRNSEHFLLEVVVLSLRFSQEES